MIQKLNRAKITHFKLKLVNGNILWHTSNFKENDWFKILESNLLLSFNWVCVCNFPTFAKIISVTPIHLKFKILSTSTKFKHTPKVWPGSQNLEFLQWLTARSQKFRFFYFLELWLNNILFWSIQVSLKISKELVNQSWFWNLSYWCWKYSRNHSV